MRHLRQLRGKLGHYSLTKLMSNWTFLFNMFLAINSNMQDIYDFSFANPNKAAFVTQKL